VTEATRRRRLDARELHRLLVGVQLAVVTATVGEIRAVLDAASGVQALEIAGKPWWLGRFGGSERPLGSVVVVSGYGGVNAAHALSCLLEAARPRLVLQVGIAGAFTGAGLGPGDLAVASSDSYTDLGVQTPTGWLSADGFAEPLAVAADGRGLRNTFVLDPDLVDAAVRCLHAAEWPDPLPRIGVGPFVTSDLVTGSRERADALADRWHAVAESMEGAAAAHICSLYGVPFLEVRGISNLVVDRDRDSWRVEEAAAVAGQAALILGEHLGDLLEPARGAAGPEADPANDAPHGGRPETPAEIAESEAPWSP